MAEVDVTDQDGQLWERQRAGHAHQTRLSSASPRGRPSSARSSTPRAPATGTLVGRAALGASFIEVAAEADAVDALRRALPATARSCCSTRRAALRSGTDGWGGEAGPELELMRRVKARFDPARTCNPGLFVGGI